METSPFERIYRNIPVDSADKVTRSITKKKLAEIAINRGDPVMVQGLLDMYAVDYHSESTVLTFSSIDVPNSHEAALASQYEKWIGTNSFWSETLKKLRVSLQSSPDDEVKSQLLIKVEELLDQHFTRERNELLGLLSKDNETQDINIYDKTIILKRLSEIEPDQNVVNLINSEAEQIVEILVNEFESTDLPVNYEEVDWYKNEAREELQIIISEHSQLFSTKTLVGLAEKILTAQWACKREMNGLLRSIDRALSVRQDEPSPFFVHRKFTSSLSHTFTEHDYEKRLDEVKKYQVFSDDQVDELTEIYTANGVATNPIRRAKYLELLMAVEHHHIKEVEVSRGLRQASVNSQQILDVMTNGPQFIENLEDFDLLFKNLEIFSQVPKERFEKFLRCFIRLDQSLVPEIQRAKEGLQHQLAWQEKPEEFLEQVENLFLTSDIPQTMKMFGIVDVLYGGELLLDMIKKYQTFVTGNIVFSAWVDHPDKQRARKEIMKVVWNDLLRAHVYSNNSSLRQFIGNFAENWSLLSEMETTGKFTQLLQGLDEINADYPQIRHTRNQRDVERLKFLRSFMSTDPSKSLTEAFTEKFLIPFQLTHPAQLLEMMDQSVQEATERAQQIWEEASRNEGQVELTDGQMFKGVAHLFNMLNEGVLTQEVYATPRQMNTSLLRTDLGLQTSGQDTFWGKYDGTVASKYASNPREDAHNKHRHGRMGGVTLVTVDPKINPNIWFDKPIDHDRKSWEIDNPEVIEGSDKFFVIRAAEDKTVRGVTIRVGFASNQIACIIATVDVIENSSRLENLMFECSARWPIPIVNEHGVVIFTEQDYERYRTSLDKKYETIEAFLEDDSYLETLRDDGQGGAHRFSLKEHSIRSERHVPDYVPEQFQQQGISDRDILLVRIADKLHDVGKGGMSGSQLFDNVKRARYILKQCSDLTNMEQAEILWMIRYEETLGETIKEFNLRKLEQNRSFNENYEKLMSAFPDKRLLRMLVIMYQAGIRGMDESGDLYKNWQVEEKIEALKERMFGI